MRHPQTYAIIYICNFPVSPQAWEANIFTYYQGENDQPSAIRSGKESYDAPNERRRFIEEYDTSRTDRNYYDELFLHKEVRETAIIIAPHIYTCIVSKLDTGSI